ncbi:MULTISPECIES: hypothetical protein [Stenotrophomonas]|uniref:hypothetical protein n=1 Tax=Stenotrophomonas TaxID=40323 RepID=UPI00128F91B8|nr:MULTISPECIES: hypothetical protein [Stenotrophomonas]
MAIGWLRNRYYHDLDMLVALISNLAVGEYSQRTPNGLSRDLSIDEDALVKVLDNYKSLFRKAKNPKPGGKQAPYSLHLRYALQYVEGEDPSVKKPPLPTEHVTALLEFVAEMARQERSWSMQTVAALIAAAASFIVASIALLT